MLCLGRYQVFTFCNQPFHLVVCPLFAIKSANDSVCFSMLARIEDLAA
jgi:hypothetical protein